MIEGWWDDAHKGMSFVGEDADGGGHADGQEAHFVFAVEVQYTLQDVQRRKSWRMSAVIKRNPLTLSLQ